MNPFHLRNVLLFQLQLLASMHSFNAVFLLGETMLNCLVSLVPQWFYCFLLILIFSMISCKFITIYLFVPAISEVSDCIFCVVDSNVCHFPMGHPCMYFYMVKHFSHLVVYYYTFDNVVFVVAILSLPLHFYSYVLSYFFILIIHFLFSVSFFYRWPYPFLDLSSPYAPLWYGVIIYLIITIANTTIILEPPYSVQKHAFNSQHEKTSLFSKNIDKRKVLKKSYILPIGHLCLQNAINFPQ